MLFEMLAGETPFRGATAQAVIAKRFTHTAPALDTIVPSLPGHVARAVERALAPEPDDRFATAGEFAHALAAPVSTAMHAAVPAPTAAPSIAVLPFANVGGAAENQFFSDGITDEVINALSRLRTLRVAARTSSYALRGQDQDVAAVGERLKVETILEGSVQRAANRIRVSARLIKVKDGFQCWAEQFDRQLDDVFAIQDEISGAIVRTLKATLLGDHGLVNTARRAGSVSAYELYLKGRFFLEQADRGASCAHGGVFLCGGRRRCGIRAGVCWTRGCVRRPRHVRRAVAARGHAARAYECGTRAGARSVTR